MLAQVVLHTFKNPPIEYPEAAIGGDPHGLRFTLTSGLFLEKRCNIPIQEQTDWTEKQVTEHHYSTLIMTMGGAMLGKVIDGKWNPMPLTAEELSLRLSEPEFQHLMAIYTDAMSKAAAEFQKIVEKLAPAPPPQEAEQIN